MATRILQGIQIFDVWLKSVGRFQALCIESAGGRAGRRADGRAGGRTGEQTDGWTDNDQSQ